ncbi:Cytochrome b6-f complex subunit 7 [Hibiscus syriacus]|uniref:Cytochrome b6-f complex subunit 7 n=1 Tax=Hibiscus syriacus TaxID=106335 RepID=A0A6A2ZHB6_HIBSY|nr:Cytochrome b6-f complex subunit 7 [Hibiscus syriacus]
MPTYLLPSLEHLLYPFPIDRSVIKLLNGLEHILLGFEMDESKRRISVLWPSINKRNKHSEHTLKALDEKEKVSEAPEPTTEVIFLCSYEGCGQTFIDAVPPLKCFIGVTPPVEKIIKTPKSSDRPYARPYEGWEKAYIHEYKLKLHLRREHPGHMSDENAENAAPNADNEMYEGSDHDAYAGKRVNGRSQKQSRAKPNVKMPPAKIARQKVSSPSPATLPIPKKQWPVKEQVFEEEDSEETEEDRDNVEDGWNNGNNSLSHTVSAHIGRCRRRQPEKKNFDQSQPACLEQSFAKVVSSLKAPSKGKGRGGDGALSSTCDAVGEIFRIAAIMNGLVLVGVAVGFVLLRIEASLEEAE